MIEVKDLVKVYETKKSKVTGVDHVNLSIKSGEIFGIVGYSGAGKSSLLRCLNLLERPTSGEIIINGVNLTKLSSKQLRQARLKIGMIFQHFYLLNAKTVFENVAFALRAANYPAAKLKGRVNDLLDMVGLAEKHDAYPSQLSGGQKQRVGIARALANDPSVLLCDEATSALDPSTTKSILNLLKRINQELGITIVIITHEMEVVKEICDRMAVMQSGKIVEEGRVYDLFSNPALPLTRDFIETVMQFEIPSHILDHCKGKIVKIQFKGAIAEEAVLSDVFQRFHVKGNFLHGKIEYIKEKPLGIFIMELVGDAADVEKATRYITEKTQSLEVISGA